MIEFTLLNVIAVVCGLLSALFLFNGFRGAFIDEVIIGILFAIPVWWIIA